MGPVLILCGVVATAVGTWRGFVLAREALGPVVHPGDPTRTAVDASRPPFARFRVRLFVRRVVVATGWLAIAMYGLLLVGQGTALG